MNSLDLTAAVPQARFIVQGHVLSACGDAFQSSVFFFLGNVWHLATDSALVVLDWPLVGISWRSSWV